MHQAPARKTSAAGALCVPGGRSKQLVVQRGRSDGPGQRDRSDGPGRMGRSEGLVSEAGQSRARILSSEVT